MTDDLDIRLRSAADGAPTALDLAAVERGAARRRRRSRTAAAMLTAAAAAAALGSAQLIAGDPQPQILIAEPGGRDRDGAPAAAPDATSYQAGTAPPAAFRERPSLTPCGTVGIADGPGPQDPSLSPAACLVQAHRDRRGAELVVSRSTDEGDPVVWYVRTLLGGQVELFANSTDDAFATQSWIRADCETVAADGTPVGCGSDEQLPAATSGAGSYDDVVAVAPNAPVELPGWTTAVTALKPERGPYGGVVLCTRIHFVNSTDQARSLLDRHWTLRGPNGTVLDPTYSGKDNELGSQALAPGAAVVRSLCFLDQGPGQYVLAWQPDPSSNKRGVWLHPL